MGLLKPPSRFDRLRWQNSVMPDLSTIDVAGKRVFLRCDLNVPLKEGVIKDDGRIKASLPTIQLLLEKGASLVIAAHLGRPKGEANPELSLAPVAKRLAELLGREVKFVGEVTGAAVTTADNHSRQARYFFLKTFVLVQQRQAKKTLSVRHLLAN